MAVDDISRLSIVGRFQKQNVVNTFHYRHTVQVSDENVVLKALIDAWLLALQTGWLARASDDYTLIGVKAFKHSGASKVPAFQRIDGFGTVAGIPHSAFVSRVITLYTASTNHRRRGRIQLSGGDASMFNPDDGSVENTEVLQMQTFANLIVVLLPGVQDDFQLCIPDTLTLPYEDIVAVRARGTPGIIRSRRIKGYFIG